MAYRDELPQGQPPVPPIPQPPAPPPAGGVPGQPPPQAPIPPTDPMGANPLGNELIGDIPPPPNAPKTPGDKHGMFALPGTPAAVPFRTPAFALPRSAGNAPTPSIGGGGGVGSVNSLQGGMPGEDVIAELLKRLAMQQGGGSAV